MELSPDTVILWRRGFITLNVTIVFTWVVMLLLVVGSRLLSSRLSTGTEMSRWQNLFEVIVLGMEEQIRGISRQEPGSYLPFVGSLFLFIGLSNILAIIPGFRPPSGSLSTTAALAICVFIAVPIYGIGERGVAGYLRNYLRPSALMLPFNVIGEISRTIALAVRLFGNVMSGTIIVGILLSITPFLFPIVMQVLGLLTGLIQAYIFAVLSMVYIASATRAHRDRNESAESPDEENREGMK